jgi:predicted regulator of Ras-like GTPase activity (Roadblock/LC7/MglB family)
VRAILARLNKTRGVRGSMISGRDGIVIASDFSLEVQEQQIGAISSQMLVALDAALSRIKMGAFKRFTVAGSDNKLLLTNAGSTILIVLLARDVNMGMINVDIKTAAEAIDQNSKM